MIITGSLTGSEMLRIAREWYDHKAVAIGRRERIYLGYLRRSLFRSELEA